LTILNNKDYEAWEERLEEDKHEEGAAQAEEKERWQTTVLLYLHDFAYLLGAILLVMLLCWRFFLIRRIGENEFWLEQSLISGSIWKEKRMLRFCLIRKDPWGL
jgi:hypothetical protein